MNDTELASKSFELIKTDLRLDEQFNADVEHPWQALHVFLTKIISYLLDHDLQGLLNALYRIDVPEEQVKQILGSGKEMAQRLATAIIDREKQKVRSRLKYSQP